MQNIVERKQELEKFLNELQQAKDFQQEHDTLKISPLAGHLERIELEKINKILETMGHPT